MEARSVLAELEACILSRPGFANLWNFLGCRDLPPEPDRPRKDVAVLESGFLDEARLEAEIIGRREPGASVPGLLPFMISAKQAWVPGDEMGCVHEKILSRKDPPFQPFREPSCGDSRGLPGWESNVLVAQP